MRQTKEPELMKRSLNSTMGEPLVASNKLAYSGHRELPIAPDVITSGPHAVRGLLSDPTLRDIRRLSRSLRLPAWVCG
jgi:hypothetical protein